MLAITVSCGKPGKGSPIPDTERMELKGNVKEMISLNPNAGKQVVRFDKDGFKTETLEYTSARELSLRAVYRYENGRNNVTRTYYNDAGTIVWQDSSSYLFDELNRVIKVSNFDHNRKSKGVIILLYPDNSANSLPREEKHFDQFGKPKVSYKYEYDENGNQIALSRYDENNGFSGKFTYTYEKDKKIETLRFDENNEIEWKETYRYHNGNPIASARYDAQGNIISRDIYKYDYKGNRLIWQFFDNEDKPLGYYEYSYSYWDN
jgi:hypothetical protein